MVAGKSSRRFQAINIARHLFTRWISLLRLDLLAVKGILRRDDVLDLGTTLGLLQG
jgi:hypothetical protein